jgi:3-dehydroquinate synthase
MDNKMEKITVALGDRSYPILIGNALLDRLGQELVAIDFPRRLAIVTNPTVAAHYAERVCGTLEQQGFRPFLLTVPDGERYKDLEHLAVIYDGLIEHEVDRGCGLIALGGGVVGDMAGFAAATFLRGIPYVQIPTTLLAQVDSSVGGKTAVNHPLGKNLIGAFYQPRLVLIDVDSLKTLDPREVVAGLAEVVKYGMIRDAAFFEWLESNAERLRVGDAQSLVYAIKRSCQIKAEIVAADEREGSVRAHLNFGHTFGHAIENLSGYGFWKHGEAVAAGMMVAVRVAQKCGYCRGNEVDRLQSLLQSLDLPVSPPDYPLADYVAAMRRDKKVKQGELSLVLNQGIGRVVLERISDIETIFSAVLEDPL